VGNSRLSARGDGLLTRRKWLATVGAGSAVAALPAFCQSLPSRTFRLWATSDPHVGTDLWGDQRRRRSRRTGARESLAEAIEQSESDQGFDWDLALCLGDFSGNQDIPEEEEGREIVRQFGALSKHRREQFYCLCGNHDASPENRWFRKWIDPTGEHTQHSGVDATRMPQPVTGTWERYSFRVGNALVLMMADRNDYAPPVGRIVDGHGPGGRPAGAVTLATFEWWKELVQANSESIILSAHHHMLRETTVASGPWEGIAPPDAQGRRRGGYHGYFAEDGLHNAGASYLYWLVDESGPEPRPEPDARAFERLLDSQPGAIDLWLGGHTHAAPDDVVNGRTLVERRWNVNFVNCAPLTQYHVSSHCVPMSRLLTFVEGRPEVRVQCYLHTDAHAPRGWYAKAERTLPLRHPFSLA